MDVWLRARQQDLAALRCRFGCDSPVVGIYHAPAGCVCWTDPVQALCAQHHVTMQSSGPISVIADFTDYSLTNVKAV